MQTQRILVIDNDQEAVEAIMDALEPEGFLVFSADSAEEGIEKAKKIHPSLIFVNIVMPGQSGLHVCKELQSSAGLSKVPILMLTIRDGAFDPRYTELFGILDVLKKPLDPDRVLETAHKYMKTGVAVEAPDDGIPLEKNLDSLFANIPEGEPAAPRREPSVQESAASLSPSNQAGGAEEAEAELVEVVGDDEEVDEVPEVFVPPYDDNEADDDGVPQTFAASEEDDESADQPFAMSGTMDLEADNSFAVKAEVEDSAEPAYIVPDEPEDTHEPPFVVPDEPEITAEPAYVVPDEPSHTDELPSLEQPPSTEGESRFADDDRPFLAAEPEEPVSSDGDDSPLLMPENDDESPLSGSGSSGLFDDESDLVDDRPLNLFEPPPEKPKQKRLVLISGIAVIVVALLAGGGWYFFLRETAPPAKIIRPPIAEKKPFKAADTEEERPVADTSPAAGTATTTEKVAGPPSSTQEEKAPTTKSLTAQKAFAGKAAAPAPPPAPAAKPEPAPKQKQSPSQEFSGGYGIQVGAFSKADGADEFAKKINAKGFPTLVLEKGGLHKVIVGPYSSWVEAKAMKEKVVKEETLKGAYLVSLP